MVDNKLFINNSWVFFVIASLANLFFFKYEFVMSSALYSLELLFYEII
ncbi:hypothetical protein BH18ACI1_BH18ACI1_07110 [soil metagenome]